jgi:hypothetical protein
MATMFLDHGAAKELKRNNIPDRSPQGSDSRQMNSRQRRQPSGEATGKSLCQALQLLLSLLFPQLRPVQKEVREVI